MKFLVSIAVIAVTLSLVNAQDCMRLRCKLPLKPGNCDERITQFYFDLEAGECKRFVYTGCDGNMNRFKNKQQCEDLCLTDIPDCTTTEAPSTTKTTAKTTTKKTTKSPSSPNLPVRCTLALDAGTCDKAVPRFYFDDQAMECKAFDYTGCGGNVNNFRSQELCESICLA